MRVLLLEDEESIRGFVVINLKRNGMEVTETDNGEDALELAEREGPFDIALLDVMLPTISGFEVCERLRKQYPRMGIIMLTAKSQEEDKIRGLELGADDYVQKPFSPGELIARIKSLFRRMNAEPHPVPIVQAASKPSKPDELIPGGAEQHREQDRQPDVSAEDEAAAAKPDAATVAEHREPPAAKPDAAPVAEHREPLSANADAGKRELVRGPFRLSAAERKLWKNGKEIILTPTEWTLVRLLMEREGQSISRDDILTEVWGRYYVGDLKVVDVNIRRIRQKLEDHPSAPAFIETVWGYGYRWKRSVPS